MADELAWFTDVPAVRAFARAEQAAGRRVGLVPTMGNLHAGHRSLMEQARRENDAVVVTLFVNPTQFGPGEDFARYPRTPEEDRALCRSAGVAAVFAPPVEAMYPPGADTTVTVGAVAGPMDGRSRPGHFAGVATVVCKLFNIVPADAAYFGLKDYQQGAVIRRLAADLDFPIRIVMCPTVREADGLALSSRNAYLSPEERRRAPAIKAALDVGRRLVEAGEADPARVRSAMIARLGENEPADDPPIVVDYVEVCDATTLAALDRLDRPVLLAVAARLGRTRLIDNVVVDPAR